MQDRDKPLINFYRNYTLARFRKLFSEGSDPRTNFEHPGIGIDVGRCHNVMQYIRID
jgi:hypothetical protein